MYVTNSQLTSVDHFNNCLQTCTVYMYVIIMAKQCVNVRTQFPQINKLNFNVLYGYAGHLAFLSWKLCSFDSI